ncbi:MULTISPECIES: hypothetical protein [unclassified Streptomyces]|uniref:hypothetical protein n=1 Tax=unclassified Streptomyces TaxID=2593676 RepID=UPI00380C3586
MLPESIPTVTVTGRFLTPDGKPLSGSVTFRAPAQLTFPEADVILGGPVAAQLDAQGAIAVTLPATDAPGMDPSGWAYTVTEALAGVPTGRSYSLLLPAESPAVDLADVAPTDPTKPTYVAVRGDSAYEVALAHGFVGTVEQWLVSLVGPQGAKGDTGPAGSRAYTGTTTPAGTLGVDGDLYVQRESTTFLGVTSETLSVWQRAGGAWTQQVPNVRGAAWYLNTTSTPSTSTKPGDLLLRTDTGDVFQRNASGWGSVVGNLKGPKGDTGTAGSTGATGTAGKDGAPGVVQSVNGKSQAAVVLAAADVGALATSAAGAAGGVATLDASGKVPAAQLPAASGGGAVSSVNGYTGAVVLAAGDVGAATASHTHTAAQVGALATTARAAANGVAPLDSASDVPLANLPDLAIPAMFAPADLGLKAWAFDPVTAVSTTAFTGNASLRFTAVVLRQTTTVSKIVFQVGGYAGTMNAGSWAAVYDSAGARKGATADMAGEAVIPGVHNAGGAAVTAALTSSVSLPAGLYYIAYVFRYSASDGPMLLQLENGAGAPPNVFGPSNVKRFGVYTATVPTSPPASITLANIDNGANRYWAGLA